MAKRGEKTGAGRGKKTGARTGKGKGKKGRGGAGELREFALAFPEAREEFPWGERVVKVKKKVFVFLGHDGDGDSGVGLSVKLPQSGMVALALPFAEPTGYGLGKSGWVSARFGPKDPLPLAMLKEWITESYRAVAPKALVRELGERDPGS
jgi:predicted DNA-binding protein (MmcQ/YjbR family)